MQCVLLGRNKQVFHTTTFTTCVASRKERRDAIPTTSAHYSLCSLNSSSIHHENLGTTTFAVFAADKTTLIGIRSIINA